MYITAALIILNLLGFMITGIDKHKAKKRKWRVPEKNFFIIALLGGSVGTYMGLLLFRHKTRHWYFMLGIPFIFLVQLVALYLLMKYR